MPGQRVLLLGASDPAYAGRMLSSSHEGGGVVRRKEGLAEMTRLLDEAFALARGLPEQAQNELAVRLIAELTAEDAFDRKIAATAIRLDPLINEALADDDAGRTEPLAPRRQRGRRRVQTADPVTQREAALTRTFGTWKGLVDAEQLKRELSEAQSDDRPVRGL